MITETKINVYNEILPGQIWNEVDGLGNVLLIRPAHAFKKNPTASFVIIHYGTKHRHN